MSKRHNNATGASRPFSFVTGYIPESYGEVVFYTTKPQGSSAHLGADVIVPNARVTWLYDEDKGANTALIKGQDDRGRLVIALTSVTDAGDDRIEHLAIDGKELIKRA